MSLSTTWIVIYGAGSNNNTRYIVITVSKRNGQLIPNKTSILLFRPGKRLFTAQKTLTRCKRLHLIYKAKQNTTILLQTYYENNSNIPIMLFL